jgi:hypothetical protein
MSTPAPSAGRRAALMVSLRFGLPAALIVAGFVILFTVDSSLKWDGWAMCVGAGLSVLLLNWLFRIGATGDREREDEEAARDFFSRHGHWPDEEPPAR